MLARFSDPAMCSPPASRIGSRSTPTILKRRGPERKRRRTERTFNGANGNPLGFPGPAWAKKRRPRRPAGLHSGKVGLAGHSRVVDGMARARRNRAAAHGGGRRWATSWETRRPECCSGGLGSGRGGSLRRNGARRSGHRRDLHRRAHRYETSARWTIRRDGFCEGPGPGHRRSLRDRRNRGRSRTASPARTLRPSGDEGRWRDLREFHGGAGDRGAGGGRPRSGRGDPRRASAR